jgi:hypothetical protein
MPPTIGPLTATGRNLPTEILVAVSGRILSGREPAIHIAVHSLSVTTDPWHRRDRWTDALHRFGRSEFDLAYLRPSARPLSVSRSKRFVPGIRADDPRQKLWSPKHRRSRRSAHRLIECRFRSWPMNSMFMFGQCAPQRVTGASLRRLARVPTLGT